MSELTAEEKAALTVCLKSILPNKLDEELEPVLTLVASMKGVPVVEEPPEEVAGPAMGGRRRRKTKRPRRKGRKSRQSTRM